MIARRSRGGGGFTVLEVLMAVSLVTIVSLASWNAIHITLGLIGKRATTEDQKTARLRTVAAEWLQAEMEFTRQLGLTGGCAATEPSCLIVVPASCVTGVAAGTPFSEGPALPQEFPYGRIEIAWDATTPVDPFTGDRYLRVVRVAIYRTADDCQGDDPFLSTYTSIGIR